tara:strand:+ start:1171 stop:3108 length:1938 start_codon:yes stop_codon:yes gene_type:complete
MRQRVLLLPIVTAVAFLVWHFNTNASWDQDSALHTYSTLERADICIVGAGLSAAVLAERHARLHQHSVLVLEKRTHIGGNCYDYTDPDTGIRVSKYGAHLFHTKYKHVWDYLQQFSQWMPWEHRVLARVGPHHVPVPVNIDTVNTLFATNLSTSTDMRQWLATRQVHFAPDNVTNSEHVGLQRVGHQLYNMIFKPYTFKQWGKFPHELGPSVLARIPVRFDHDDRYFSDPYQALPADGYTAMFQKMFASPRITVRLGTDYFDVRGSLQCGHVYFTGPIDAYFAQTGMPKLEYRSLDFERVVYRNTRFYQPASVVNAPGLEYNYTRAVEYKHFLNQSSADTVVFFERSNDHGEPYYPVPNARNQLLFQRYKKLAAQETDVTFVGRLANYKYFNMDETVKNALEIFSAWSEAVERVHLIVAHCREDLSWMEAWVRVLRVDRVFIYSKCRAPVGMHGQGVDVVRLPNTGREGHSWLYHMLREDVAFARQNIFVQGRHEVQLRQIHATLRENNRPFIDFHDKKILQGYYLAPDCGLTKHSALLRAMYQQWKPPTASLPLHGIRCTMRGEFLVTDNDIHRLKQRHGRARLLQIQHELEHYNDPVLGHVLERMWGVLFSGGNTTYYDPRHLRPMWRRAAESVWSFWSLGYD